LKKITKFLVLISILIFGFLLGFLISTNVSATSNINYTFQDNILYNNNSINIEPIFNFINKTEPTELYNSTYSFTDDTIGGYPSGWTYNEGALTEIQIEAEKENHSKTISLNDWGSSTCYIHQTFDSAQTYGAIEFWFLAEGNSANRIQDVRFGWGTLGDVNTAWRLAFSTNTFTLYHSGGTDVIGGTFEANKWYHIKFTFDCTSGGYDGNGLRGVRPYINGFRYPSYTFWYATASLTKLGCTTWGGTCIIDEKIHYDAFGYSWDSTYMVGQNVAPFFNITSDIQIEKDEFAFDNNGIVYDTGWDGEANKWVSSSGGVSLGGDEGEAYDRRLSIVSTDTTIRKIEKDFNVSNGIFNFTLNIDYLAMLNPNSYFQWNISSSSSIITMIRISYEVSEFRLKYSKDTFGEQWEIMTTIDMSGIFHRKINLFIGEMMCLLTYSDENTNIKGYSFRKLDFESGLDKIVFFSYMIDDDDSQSIIFDSIGTYVNGSSLANDFGIFSTSLGVSNWRFKYYNLIEINALGNFSLGAYSTYFGGNFESLKDFYNYTEEEIKNYNIYDLSINLNEPFLALTSNQIVLILSFKISGVLMTDGTTNFISDFYYESVNIDESYFYVDSSNRLQFNLIADDNYTEWIELRFDILVIWTENRSIQFKSNIDGISTGYVHLAYWGWTTTNIYFPTYLTTTISYLPQGYVIFTMSIIITDQDITWYDHCSGYITNLKFLYSPGGYIPIIDIYLDLSVLIIVLIPLIILLVPTLALSVKFGKKIILPMFIVMSLLCAMTNLIPIWLFFVIAIACGSLIFISQKKGVN